MSEHPILFSGPMVRAILEGRKTQTRRVIKPQPLGQIFLKYGTWNNVNELEPWTCPYGGESDRLWVRETHFLFGTWIDDAAGEMGDYNDDPRWRFIPEASKGVMFPTSPPEKICTRKDESGWFKRPSIHMPRWANRIELGVTEVRVRRLREISEEDAKAEGVEPHKDSAHVHYVAPFATAFKELWDGLNKDRGFGWDMNPWIWAITFGRLKL